MSNSDSQFILLIQSVLNWNSDINLKQQIELHLIYILQNISMYLDTQIMDSY